MYPTPPPAREVYRCHVDGACPGGEPGTCAPGRDSEAVACGECMGEHYVDGPRCVPCSAGKGEEAVIAVVCFIVPFILLAAHKGGNSIVLGRATSVLAATAAMSGSLNAVQTMSIFNNLPQVRLPGALHGLFKFFDIFVFNLDLLRYDCLGPVDVPARYFVRTIVPICTV